MCKSPYSYEELPIKLVMRTDSLVSWIFYLIFSELNYSGKELSCSRIQLTMSIHESLLQLSPVVNLVQGKGNSAPMI